MNGVLANAATLDNYYFNENNSNTFRLGSYDSANYYLGYVYNMKVSNYALSNIAVPTTTCGCSACTTSGDCLIACNSTQYYEKSSKTCKSCNSTCLYGCARSDDCSLHQDQMCGTFSVLQSRSCLTCLDNAYNAPPCTCVGNSTYSATSRICECFTGYMSVNNTCIYCDRYIQAAEIKSGFSTTFVKLAFQFPVKIKIYGLTCDTIFPPEVTAKFGKGYSCNFEV